MTSHKVLIQAEAKENIAEIVWYISFILKNPSAALKTEIQIVESINSLRKFPERASMVKHHDIRLTTVIRKLVVGNYLIFFFIDNNKMEVNVIAVHHKNTELNY